jgi:hypothetical protein
MNSQQMSAREISIFFWNKISCEKLTIAPTTMRLATRKIVSVSRRMRSEREGDENFSRFLSTFNSISNPATKRRKLNRTRIRIDPSRSAIYLKLIQNLLVLLAQPFLVLFDVLERWARRKSSIARRSRLDFHNKNIKTRRVSRGEMSKLRSEKLSPMKGLRLDGMAVDIYLLCSQARSCVGRRSSSRYARDEGPADPLANQLFRQLFARSLGEPWKDSPSRRWLGDKRNEINFYETVKM